MKPKVKWTDWLRYSGAAFTISLNPLYWWSWPYFKQYRGEFHNDLRWEFKFLFLRVNIWFDDGGW